MENSKQLHQITTCDYDNHLSTATGVCTSTGNKYTTAPFSTIGYMSWILNESNIQDCLAELSLDDREFLISGLSPQGWLDIFGEEDEE